MKKRVLLIGAGPTSSLIAYNIKQCRVLSKILEIHVWEKAKGIGGRFATSRNPENLNCYLDLGAQYLTQSHSWSKPYFENLEKNGQLKRLDTTNLAGFRNDEKKLDYVCCSGAGSIVKNLFEQAKLQNSIRFNTRAHSISKGFVNESGEILYDITAEADQSDPIKETFHIVISTIPIPEIVQLHNFDTIFPDMGDWKIKLQNVKYTSRYALGLFFNEQIVLQESEQIINFVQNSDVIRYWSLENRKRVFPANTSEEPAAITVHTSVDFGAKHRGDTEDSLKEYLLEKTKEHIKSIQDSTPTFVKCHKWKYSQVLEPYPGSPGVVEISKDPLFLISGDGLSYSGFEGCIFSAEQTTQHLRTSLTL